MTEKCINLVNKDAVNNYSQLSIQICEVYNNATTNAQITYQITDIKEVLNNRFTEALSSSYHTMFSPFL
tara:strand:- start:130 stop:336 length:207 start_codon:yes stop_codon:yes gene_type:complete